LSRSSHLDCRCADRKVTALCGAATIEKQDAATRSIFVMTDDRELELVSAALDGELSNSDQSELDTLLEKSTDARQLKSDLDQLDSLLSSVPDLEPPASLHASLMSQTKAAQRGNSVIRWLLRILPGDGLRYAVAAAAGALVVAVFFNDQTIFLDETDISDLVGTMAPVNLSADAILVDSFLVRGDGLEGVVQLQISEGVMVLVVRVDAVKPVDVSVDLTGAGLEPDAVAQIDSEFESITITGQALRMRAVGQQKMSILLRRVNNTAFAGEATITLEFSSEGKLLQRGSLTATLKGVGQ
jgi:hypothetical protein